MNFQPCIDTMLLTALLLHQWYKEAVVLEMGWRRGTDDGAKWGRGIWGMLPQKKI